MKLREAVGKRVARLLAERGITQYRLSKDGGIPRSTISIIISAKHSTVKLDTVYQIADTLGLSLQEFFDDPIFDDVED